MSVIHRFENLFHILRLNAAALPEAAGIGVTAAEHQQCFTSSAHLVISIALLVALQHIPMLSAPAVARKLQLIFIRIKGLNLRGTI